MSTTRRAACVTEAVAGRSSAPQPPCVVCVAGGSDGSMFVQRHSFSAASSRARTAAAHASSSSRAASMSSLSRLLLVLCVLDLSAAVAAENACHSMNRALAVNRACRCFGGTSMGGVWIGCTREKMPRINEALNALENETSVEKLWLWDNIIPVLPASLFARVRPERLILESSGLGHIAGRRAGGSQAAFPAGPLDVLGSGLKVLELKNNVLKECRAEMFRNLSGLLKLDLSGNRVTELDARSFGALPALTSLSLYRNDLLRISDGAFRGLGRLRSLNLASNHLSAITANMFEGLGELEHLNLENNAIARVEEGAFRHMRKLRTLNLGGNFLVKLRLSELPALERLFVNNNSIASVRHVELDAARLQTLNLDKNQLVELPSRAFVHLSDSLEVLSLANNKIAMIEKDAFRSLARLRTLSLQNNEIGTLPDGVFTPLFRLRDLFLSKNRLQSLEEHTLDGLASLQVLSVAHNELKAVNAKAFAKVIFLQRLYLNGNALQTIGEQTLAALQPTLTTIDISANPWDCNCRLLWLLSWLDARREQLVNDERIGCVQGSFNETFSKLAIDCAALEEERRRVAAGGSGADGSNSAWITAIGVVLAVVSLLILFCIALMYLRDRGGANFVLVLQKRDLKRTPSDMDNLLGARA